MSKLKVNITKDSSGTTMIYDARTNDPLVYVKEIVFRADVENLGGLAEITFWADVENIDVDNVETV